MVYVEDAIVRHPPRSLGEIIAKVRRITEGNTRGGPKPTGKVVGTQDFVRGWKSVFIMPHLRALNPFNIVGHLRGRGVKVSSRVIFNTWCAAVVILTCGGLLQLKEPVKIFKA